MNVLGQGWEAPNWTRRKRERGQRGAGLSPGPTHADRLLPLPPSQVCSVRGAGHGDGGAQSDHSDPAVPQRLVLTVDWLLLRDGECQGDFTSLEGLPLTPVSSSIPPSFLHHPLLLEHNLEPGFLLSVSRAPCSSMWGVAACHEPGVHSVSRAPCSSVWGVAVCHEQGASRVWKLHSRVASTQSLTSSSGVLLTHSSARDKRGHGCYRELALLQSRQWPGGQSSWVILRMHPGQGGSLPCPPRLIPRMHPGQGGSPILTCLFSDVSWSLTSFLLKRQLLQGQFPVWRTHYSLFHFITTLKNID